MTMPSFVGAGPGAETNPSWPTHLTGDLGVRAIETNNENPNTPVGYTRVAPAAVRADTRATVDYKIAASASEGAPVSPGVAVNHAWCVMAVFRDVDPDDPFDLVATAIQNADTTGRAPGFETHLDDCLVVYVIAYSLDAALLGALLPVNSTLANLTVRYDAGTTTGNGGGIAIITGEKANAGAVEPTTWTQTSSALAVMTLVLKPKRSVSVTGTVTISGSPAPDGGGVRVVDITQADDDVLGSVTGGAGGFTALVRYDDHDYIAIYDNGTERGASEVGPPP